MTDEHRANLRKLANYLKTIPQDRFDMNFFAAKKGMVIPMEKYDCGTVCCAAGHGPHAGIPFAEEDYCWEGYTQRVFGVNYFDDAYMWMFSAGWAAIDNSPQGAAKRIEMFLDETIPEKINPYKYPTTLPYQVEPS